MGRHKATSDARNRILDTADRLFYSGGVRAVGIDRIIAESGVAKMTLYSHFRSKDDLIVEVLRHREGRFLEWFAEARARHAAPDGDKVGGLFGALREWFDSPDFRGCAFINTWVALAEPAHPGAVFAREHKERFRVFLAELIRESLDDAAATLAPAIDLLIEGAIVTAQMQESSEAAEVARVAAMRLLSRPEKG